MDKTEKVYRSRKTMLSNNFLGGIAWGLGVTVGLTLFFAVLAFIGKNIDFVPVVGDFIADVINYILQNSAHLPGQ